MAYVIHLFRMSAFFLIAGFFAHLAYHRRGARAFVGDRLRRIALPLAAGFVLLGAAVKVLWLWGLQRAGAVPATASPWRLGIEGYYNGDAYHGAGFSWVHLWFLYYLLLFYAAWLLARAVLAATGAAQRLRPRADAVLRTLHVNPLGLLAFGAPVSLGFWLNSTSLYAIETPNKTVLPLSGPMITYGTWFVFGWLLRRQPELLEYWRQRWAVHALAGLAISVALFELVFTRQPPDRTPAALGMAGVAYAAGSGLACVLLVAGFTGFFERFASSYRPSVRYLADSSYWMYLLHLPIVLWLQVLAGPWHLHWTVKFSVILLVTLALCLLSYQHLVRYTWLGTLLNGPRRPGLEALPAQPARLAAPGAAPA